MADLLTRLQDALGTGYRVERELGGGGMSRVFLAEEVRLGRRVVVKVLPPEMAAGVSVDRFEREIQLAARLQHPHIVPLLTAGSSDDLLYYIMPFIEGESLRAKLAREGELPVPEALRILRDVLDALAYAHRHQVVHRDIKPDNVLLAEGHALVTDFGVAKAVSDSTGGQSLTSLGVALGTPLYMAPEQAAANPNIDHRADLYAVGVLAYEMLCGRPPFLGPNPQAVLSAHVTQAPEPCIAHRPTVPAALNELVMRCLEKHPADRWQRAEELLPHLEAILTPTGGTQPTGAAPVISSSTEAAIRQAHPVRVATLFALASVGVLAIVYALVQAIGLPDWVLYGAIGLLAVGLPIMLVTGRHERRRAMARSIRGMPATPQSGVQRYFTWPRALVGGGLAFAGLGVIAAAYMAMRVLGIGPVGTLVATGALGQRDLVVVADFENRTADSGLAMSVTDAFRVDLGQSRTVRLLDPTEITAALQRMSRPRGGPLYVELASEIAQREGAKVVVAGEIGTLGRGFVLSARVVSPADGRVLTAVRETAEDDGAIIGAVDRLSKRLRERIGESLRTIRATPQLSQVTTSSLPALKKYSEGSRANGLGDFDRAATLFEEAVAADTAFASAFRGLAVALSNAGKEQSRIAGAATKAFQHRGRLPDVERYLTAAFYYTVANPNADSLRAAYLSLLEIDPGHRAALNNLALQFNLARQWERAEEFARRGLQSAPIAQLHYNLTYALVAQGRMAAAESTVAQWAAEEPNAQSPVVFRGLLAVARRDFAAAENEYRALGERFGGSRTATAVAALALASLDETQGRLGSAERRLTAHLESQARDGRRRDYLLAATLLGWLDLRYRSRPAGVLRRLDLALERFPLASLQPEDRPYLSLAELYAAAGRNDRAKQLLAEFEAVTSPAIREDTPLRHAVAGAIALAERRYPEAIAAYQARTAAHQVRFAAEQCNPCGMFDLAGAYDQAGQRDSAIAAYDRAVATPSFLRLFNEAGHLAQGYRRLGELYHQRGEREKALEYYDKFVDLWKDADPELQPVVRDVKQRMARLAGEP